MGVGWGVVAGCQIRKRGRRLVGRGAEGGDILACAMMVAGGRVRGQIGRAHV